MEEIGFLEIACYAKGMASIWGKGTWDPLPEYGLEETSEFLSLAWERWNQSEKSRQFYTAVKSFGLSEKEAYIIIMGMLPCLNRDFLTAYEWIDQDKNGGMAFILDMYCKNHQAEEEEVRSGFLRYWFLKERRRSDWPETEDWMAFRAAGYENIFPYEEKGLLYHLPPGKSTLTDLVSEEETAIKEVLQLVRYMEKDAENQEIFYLYGPWGAGKKTCVSIVSEKMRLPLFMTDISNWKDTETDPEKEIVREAAFGGGILCVTGYESEYQRVLNKVIRISHGILPYIFVIGEGSPVDIGAEPGWIVIPFGIPTMSTRYGIWVDEAAKYPIGSQISLQEMANKYLMTSGQIRDTMKMAWKMTRYHQKTVIDKEELTESCHQFLKGRFGRSVKKVEGVFQWEDLVLPERQKEKLNAACNQLLYRHHVLEKWKFQEKMVYGTGISMIFAGPPGTGKTMAAQVIAKRLGMELYKVELASVVSKFIGETEKNLEEIFEQARKSQVILFFDEADVLFGKRTEVRDSNDKYSNMEAAFLLQKMEEYQGVVILATNLLQNMDEAFKRRMKFVVDFPFPDSSQRLELWKKSIPPEIPVETGLDLQFLASHFELSGSNIKNVVYQGAFFAAAGEGILGMKELLLSVRNEYEKSGKVLSRQELGPYSVLFDESWQGI